MPPVSHFTLQERKKQPEDISYFVDLRNTIISDNLETLYWHQENLKRKFDEEEARYKNSLATKANPSYLHLLREQYWLEKHIINVELVFDWLNGYPYFNDEKVLDLGMPLFLKYSETILNNASYYCVTSKEFSFGQYQLNTQPTLGLLISLWQQNLFLENCPDCGKACLVTQVMAGTSECEEWTAYCTHCDTLKHGNNVRSKCNPPYKRMEFIMKLKTKPKFSNPKEKTTLLQLMHVVLQKELSSE